MSVFAAEKCPRCGKMESFPSNIFPKDYDPNDKSLGFDIDGETYGGLLGMRCQNCGDITPKDLLIENHRQWLQENAELQAYSEARWARLNAMTRAELVHEIRRIIEDKKTDEDMLRCMLDECEVEAGSVEDGKDLVDCECPICRGCGKITYAELENMAEREMEPDQMCPICKSFVILGAKCKIHGEPKYGECDDYIFYKKVLEPPLQHQEGKEVVCVKCGDKIPSDVASHFGFSENIHCPNCSTKSGAIPDPESLPEKDTHERSCSNCYFDEVQKTDPRIKILCEKERSPCHRWREKAPDKEGEQ